jgi:hypothetical protein
MDHLRISTRQQLDSRETQKNEHAARGQWNGQPVSLRLEKDIDNEIRKSEYRRQIGLDAPADRKGINQRTVSLDARTQQLSPAALGKLARVFGGEAGTTKLAQQYLKYFRGEQEKPKQEAGLNHLLQHYVALSKLSAALKASDADFIARMTPQSDGSASLSELAEKLIQAGDDPAKMQALLGDIGGLTEASGGMNEGEDWQRQMKMLRFQPDELKRKLQDAQQLPTLSTAEKQLLQEKVDDVLLQLDIDEGSRIKAAKNGIEKGFESGNPETFIESYASAIEHTGSFIQTLSELAKRHKPEELRHVIPLMKQTLADELQLGQDERSTDKVKLQCLLSELSYMHISTTLIEKIKRLMAGLQRIYGKPDTA